MTNHEKNVVNMLDSALNCYDENKTVYASCPAIVECFEELDTIVGDIKEVDKKYLQATSGKTAEKNSAFDDVVNAALPIVGALKAYASKNKLQDLKAKVSFTESELRKLSTIELIEESEIFINLTRPLLTNLAGYLITEEKLVNLESTISLLESKSGDKSTGYASRSSLRKLLTEKFSEAEKLTEERLDHLHETIRAEHKDLYEIYFAARVVKDYGGSHTKTETTTAAAAGTVTSTTKTN
jgi:hypothetical protein